MNYYDKNAQEFVDGTVDTDMTIHYNEFLPLIPENGSILDAGCGSGRDTLKFKSLGYNGSSLNFEKLPEELKDSLFWILKNQTHAKSSCINKFLHRGQS